MKRAAAKKEALVSKVLARLYPHKVSRTPNLEDPNLQAKVVLGSNGDQKDMKDSPAATECLQDAGKGPPEEQKIYTANLPPENYVQSSHDCVSSTKGSEESEDTEEDGKRSRRRRRKNKVSIKPQAEAENNNNMLPIPSCPQTSDRVPINKNKRRKLQRKRQKERLKAAGLWTKAMDPSHQCKEEIVSLDQPSEEHAEEDLQKKSEDLLDFLNATQDLYFTDGRSKCANDTVPADAVFETLNLIESGEMSSSDVTALHHLKTLVLLQDIERLKDCLDSFKEHSSLPVDHRVALCSLFRYWITDILPIRKK